MTVTPMPPERFAALPTADLLYKLAGEVPQDVLDEARLAAFTALRQSPVAGRSYTSDYGSLAVIDTNVILDMLFWKDPHTEKLLAALREKKFFAVRSRETIEELADVITRSQFALSVPEQESLLRDWAQLSVPVRTDTVSPVKCLDPDDQKFLDLSVSSHADVLITKDKLVIRAGRKLCKRGLKVLTPINDYILIL